MRTLQAALASASSSSSERSMVGCSDATLLLGSCVVMFSTSWTVATVQYEHACALFCSPLDLGNRRHRACRRHRRKVAARERYERSDEVPRACSAHATADWLAWRPTEGTATRRSAATSVEEPCTSRFF